MTDTKHLFEDRMWELTQEHLDRSSTFSYSELPTAADNRRIEDSKHFEAIEKARALTAGQAFEDATATTPEGAAIGYLRWKLSQPEVQVDPGFTQERWAEKLQKAAESGLDPEYLSWLRGAASEQHFDALEARARQRQEMRKRLSEYGFGGQALNMLVQTASPTNLALAIGSGSLGAAIAYSRNFGLLARSGMGAGFGAAGNVGVEWISDQLGDIRSASDYLVAAVVGAGFGAIASPITSSPLARDAHSALSLGVVKARDALLKSYREAGLRWGKVSAEQAAKAAADAPNLAPGEIVRNPARVIEKLGIKQGGIVSLEEAMAATGLKQADAERIVASLKKTGVLRDPVAEEAAVQAAKQASDIPVEEIAQNAAREAAEAIAEGDIEGAIARAASAVPEVTQRVAAQADEAAPEAAASKPPMPLDEAVAQVSTLKPTDQVPPRVQEAIGLFVKKQVEDAVTGMRADLLGKTPTQVKRLLTKFKVPYGKDVTHEELVETYINNARRLADDVAAGRAPEGQPETAPVTVKEPEPLPPDPKAMKNTQYVGDWKAADANTYRIMSTEPNGLGEYRVFDLTTKKALGTFDTLKQAREAIARVEPVKVASTFASRAQDRPVLLDDLKPQDPHPGRLIAFHTTGHNFEKFELDKGANFFANDLGLHFGNKGQARKVGVSVLSTAEIAPPYENYRPRTIPVVLEMKNPITLRGEIGSNFTANPTTLTNEFLQMATDAEPPPGLMGPQIEVFKQMYRSHQGNWTVAEARALQDDVRKELSRSRTNNQPAIQKIREFLLAHGYDGARYQNTLDGAGWSYIAFKPGTVRSLNVPEILFSLGKTNDHLFTPDQLAKLDQVVAIKADEVVNILDRYLPKQFGYEVLNARRTEVGGRPAYGGIDLPTAMVKVVVASEMDPRITAYHEVTHALEALGAFSEKDLQLLTKYADKHDLWNRYNISGLYGEAFKNALPWPDLHKKLMRTELIAAILGERMAGVEIPRGIVSRIIEPIVKMLRAVRDALGLRGVDMFRTIDDVFADFENRVYTTKVNDGRPVPPQMPYALAQASKQSFASASPIPPDIDPRYLNSEAFDTLDSSMIARTGGFWRFDRAGIVGKAENPITRLVGGALLNDTVGKIDHSLNPFSADLDQVRIFNSYAASYNSARAAAFNEWAESQRLAPLQRWAREAEFYEEVGLAVRNTDPTREFHPAVLKLAERVRQVHAWLLEEMKNPLVREGLQGRPLPGAEQVAENANYLWRKFHPDKLRSLIDGTGPEAIGYDGVVELVSGAIRSAQKGLGKDYADRLAKGYVKHVYGRALGAEDIWSRALGEADFEAFARVLRQDTDFTEAEIEAIIQRAAQIPSEAGKMPNLKHRVLLDENFSMDIAKKNGTGTRRVAFTDLLDNNVDRVFKHYLRRVSGRLALARVRLEHPVTGELLVNGINSDAEFNAVQRIVRQYAADYMRDVPEVHKLIERDAKNLQFAYDRIRGVPDMREQGSLAEWAQRYRRYSSMRLMGQVGIAQTGESAAPMAVLGLDASLKHAPGLKRIIDEAGDLRQQRGFMREIENIGIGVERLHGWAYNAQTAEDFDGLPFTVSGRTWKDRLDGNLLNMERATYEMSGMMYIQQQQELWVAASVAEKIAGIGRKAQPSASDLKRLAQLGMDQDMLTRVLDQIQTHTSFEPGPFFGRRIERLNLNDWTDLEARAALENAMFRMTRKLIQQTDVGNDAFWMSDPIWKTLLQFRRFTFTAWANQLQYNIHMGDPAALAMMVMSVGWNAAVRAIQIAGLSLGRSDAEQYREKHMSPAELAKAGFERSGWSSLLPMGIDTGIYLAGYPTQFNARSTGQPSNILGGSPIFSFVDNLLKGTSGVLNSVATQRPISQAEARAFAALLPYQNMMPFAQGLSLAISGLPDKAPSRVIR